MKEFDIDELEFLANKATKGPWWIDSHGTRMVSLDSLDTIFSIKCDPKTAKRHEETGNLSNWRNDWDASYIATANPQNILAMIAEIKRLRNELKTKQATA